MPRTLDRYVIREILPPFALTLLIFTFLLVLPPVMEHLENLLAKGVDWATAGLLQRPAVLGGRAMATILLVTEEPERHLAALRRIVGESGGVSAWDGKLLARIVAKDGMALRRLLVPALVELCDGLPLPALWTI